MIGRSDKTQRSSGSPSPLGAIFENAAVFSAEYVCGINP
jgi:hypothetical protein